MSDCFDNCMKLVDECDCDCHKENETGLSVMHCFPCCAVCKVCGRRIKYSLLDYHEKNCKDTTHKLHSQFTSCAGPR